MIHVKRRRPPHAGQSRSSHRGPRVRATPQRVQARARRGGEDVGNRREAHRRAPRAIRLRHPATVSGTWRSPSRSRVPGALTLGWLRRRREAERLANADAQALFRDYDAEAYWEARRRERDVILPDGTTHQGRTPTHWRRVALIVARRTGRRVGLDTATRMLARR